MSHFFVLDIETTGLNPRRDAILEVAALHLDFDTLEIKSVFSKTCYFDREFPGVAGPIHSIVEEMHTVNGLWEECKASKETTFDLLSAGLATFMKEAGAEERSVYLCGNSVHFDHSFLEAQAHEVRPLLSHRVVDVSTLKCCVNTWGSTPLEELKDSEHRALSDCLSSLEVLRLFRKMLIT